MTDNLDNIFTWLMSGIGINTDDKLLYLVDTKEQILFNLVKEDHGFDFRNNQNGRSKEDVKILKRLRSRFQSNDSFIIMINKKGEWSDLLPNDSNMDHEARKNKWDSLGKEMRDFIKRNDLILEKYTLIA